MFDENVLHDCFLLGGKMDQKMQDIKNPHNNYIENMLSNKNIAQEFFTYHLPEDVKKVINLDTLEPKKDTFVDMALRKLETDILFSANFNGRIGYIYLLIEAQRKPDRTMPIRIFKYILAAMEFYMGKNKEMPIIYPMVLYNGDGKWSYPKGLISMQNENNRQLFRDVITQDFKLIDVSETEDDVIKNRTLTGIFETALKFARKRDIMSALDALREGFVRIGYEKNILTSTLVYLANIGDAQKDKIIEWARTEISQEVGDEIMTLAEKWRQEGIEQGIEQGALQIAVNMLNKKFDLQAISDATNIPIDKLKKLQAQNEDQFKK